MRRSSVAAAATLALTVACVHTAEGPGDDLSAVAPSEPPTQFLDGRQTRVHLLARRLLVRGEKLPAAYAYYCYLLFSDSSAASEAARHAAAVAYLRLLRDVADVSGVVKPEHMAVLLAPIRDRASAAETLRSRDVDVFLRSYDYDSARMLANAVSGTGRALPRIAIVGLRTPLAQDAQLAKADISVVNLDVADEKVTEKRVLRLRDDLEAGKTEVSQKGELVVLRLLRDFFALVGDAGEDTVEATKT